VANAAVSPLDTPAVAAAKLDHLARYNYEASRKTSKVLSLSGLFYDEALAAAPAVMVNFARSNY